MIKTIVVSTDGSTHAAKAIDLAADIGNEGIYRTGFTRGSAVWLYRTEYGRQQHGS